MSETRAGAQKNKRKRKGKKSRIKSSKDAPALFCLPALLQLAARSSRIRHSSHQQQQQQQQQQQHTQRCRVCSRFLMQVRKHRTEKFSSQRILEPFVQAPRRHTHASSDKISQPCLAIAARLAEGPTPVEYTLHVRYETGFRVVRRCEVKTKPR